MSSNFQAEEEGEDYDDDDEENTPTKKKRGAGKKRKKGFESDDEDGFDGRKRKKKGSFKKMQKKMTKLMEIVIRYGFIPLRYALGYRQISGDIILITDLFNCYVDIKTKMAEC